MSGMLVGGLRAMVENGKRFHFENKYFLASKKLSHIRLHRERAVQMAESVMKRGIYYGTVTATICASYGALKQATRHHLTTQSRAEAPRP